MPVRPRGRKGSGSRADWLSLSPSSSRPGGNAARPSPPLPGTLARQPGRAGSVPRSRPAKGREGRRAPSAEGLPRAQRAGGSPALGEALRKTREGPVPLQHTPPGGRPGDAADATPLPQAAAAATAARDPRGDHDVT